MTKLANLERYSQKLNSKMLVHFKISSLFKLTMCVNIINHTLIKTRTEKSMLFF